MNDSYKKLARTGCSALLASLTLMPTGLFAAEAQGLSNHAVALVRDVPHASAHAKPTLVVVISVDQFSADLFAEYRRHFTGGFRRMQTGVTFPLAYQGHATTETCPGHATILTGSYPARTGIIGNDWTDQRLKRGDKTVYCAEDSTVPESSSRQYTPSSAHLLVPTLGDRLKLISPRSRIVSVAGKDRAAIMLAGHNPDVIWWWDGRKFSSYSGRAEPSAVTSTNSRIAVQLGQPSPGHAMPDQCIPYQRPILLEGGRSVGASSFARAAGDYASFRASPGLDEAVVDLAAAMVRDQRLGGGPVTDVLTVGMSATDYVGHTYGTAGSEMCVNLLALDQSLARLFDQLDAVGIDYLAVLTADHGGLDIPERSAMQAGNEASRIAPDFSAEAIGTKIAKKTGLRGPVLFGGSFADMWIKTGLTRAEHATVERLAIAAFLADRSVYAVYDRKTIIAQPMPSGAPDTWTILERVRASYNLERGGDFYVVLKPRRTPIAGQAGSYIAMHGSPWDYDRRVPILFWHRGIAGFEQPLAVGTVDIMPTLASLVELKIPQNQIDGRCLDIVPGDENNCIFSTNFNQEK